VANNCGNDQNCVTPPGTVTVIDGVTNNTTTVPVQIHPRSVAINRATNQIYVVNRCGAGPCRPPYVLGTVTVIDGTSLSTQNVTVGIYPLTVVADSDRNTMYVTNKCGSDPNCAGVGTVTVINGQGVTLPPVIVGVTPNALALNGVTNQIYVVNQCGNDLSCTSLGTVTNIDGATLNTQPPINVGAFPDAISVNAVTNQIYVANSCGTDPSCASLGTVNDIDGSTNNPTTISVGAFPDAISANPVNNQVYVANSCGNDLTCASAGTVTVINGATLTTAPPVGVGNDPVTATVNPATNTSYVANFGDNTVSVIAGPNAIPAQFVALPPCRLYDSRPAHGGSGPLQGGQTGTGDIRKFSQKEGCGDLSTAIAYSLNITVIPHGRLGYLTLWPTGEEQPTVSTLNSLDGRVKANAVIIPGGYMGAVNAYATDTTDIVVDINGYFAPVSSQTLAFYPLTPCRVVDTRKDNFPSGLGPPALMGGPPPRDFPILESPCIPTGVNPAAYSFNFTVVPINQHPIGYLSVWPTGQSQPVVSTLNDQTGTIVANAAIVPASTDPGTLGEITVYSTDGTQLLIDVNGYFAPAGTNGLSLYPAAPCRALDTRRIGTGQPFSGQLMPALNVVGGPCGPPATAQAYVFNATVVPVGPLGYLALWPDTEMQPVVSTLNAVDGAITNNMAIVPTINGSIDAYAGNGLTQLLLDISSYSAP
jgi:DNA-binding beta-propeller fold protein YncE